MQSVLLTDGVEKLCIWIEHGETKQQVAARFRVSLRRSCVVTDADVQALWDSRIWAVSNRPYAKVRKRKQANESRGAVA